MPNSQVNRATEPSERGNFCKQYLDHSGAAGMAAHHSPREVALWLSWADDSGTGIRDRLHGAYRRVKREQQALAIMVPAQLCASNRGSLTS